MYRERENNVNQNIWIGPNQANVDMVSHRTMLKDGRDLVNSFHSSLWFVGHHQFTKLSCSRKAQISLWWHACQLLQWKSHSWSGCMPWSDWATLSTGSWKTGVGIQGMKEAMPLVHSPSDQSWWVILWIGKGNFSWSLRFCIEPHTTSHLVWKLVGSLVQKETLTLNRDWRFGGGSGGPRHQRLWRLCSWSMWEECHFHQLSAWAQVAMQAKVK